MQINRSHPAYIATLNAIVTHKQNAERLARCAADSRYPENQRKVFAEGAADEYSSSRQAVADAEYFREHGEMPIRFQRAALAA